MMKSRNLVLTSSVLAAQIAFAQFQISPGEARIVTGVVRFTATPSTSGATMPALTWSLVGAATGSSMRLESTGSSAILIVPKNGWGTSSIVLVKAEGGGQVALAEVQRMDPAGALVVVPVIGFEQAGASAADSKQKFFFSFFISRPLPLGKSGFEENSADEDKAAFGPPLRWWGSVRIASYPQQVSSGVGQFASGFGAQVTQLKVNELAQMGEFTTGLEYRLTSFPNFFPSIGGSGRERVNLGLIAGFGAISPLNPTQSLELWKTPPVGSSQRERFLREFPAAASFTHVGFVTPDRDRFFWEYGAGLRLTTQFFDKAGAQSMSPAMVSWALGRNQLVTGGLSQGIVQRIEAFFPLPLGERFSQNVTTLYLFGRVQMRLARPELRDPFILEPAGADVRGYSTDVSLHTVRASRDLYTIGVGLDAVKLIKSIVNPGSGGGSSQSTPQAGAK